MKEEVDGFRRTSVKTRDKDKLRKKLEEFEARGEETKVFVSGGYYYLYIRKDKPLGEPNEA
jgi:hypothetical protein